MRRKVDIKSVEIKVLKNDLKINASLLSHEMGEFYKEYSSCKKKDSVHTAKLFYNEKSYFISEDTVQDKTIDKVVKKAIFAGIDVTKSFIMVNGCLSLEMVKKVVKYKIPILASCKEITCQGLLEAIKYDLTILGFVRDDKMRIYSYGERIKAF